MLCVHIDLLRTFDNGRVAQLVFLCCSIRHRTLLSVLSDRFDINDTALNYLQSHLSERIDS